MTKIFNIIIVVLVIALVTTFIVSAVSLQSKTDKILSSYSARREELASGQQQIQNMIVTLNSTLQSEITKQQALASELGITINNTIINPQANSVITQPVNVPTTPVVSVPAPVQQPVVSQPIMRRTRAS